MSNKFFAPQNEYGKALVPVATEKTNTIAGSDEFIHLSWLETTDEFNANPTGDSVLVTDKALAKAVEAATFAFDLNGEEVTESITITASNGATISTTAEDGAVSVSITLTDASATAKGVMKLYSENASTAEDGTYTAKAIDAKLGKKREVVVDDFTIENGHILIPLATADALLSFLIENEFYMPTITVTDTHYKCDFFDADDANYNNGTSVTVTYIPDLQA